MSPKIKKWVSNGWRLALCLLLLTWIFHKIFLHEGELAAQRDGLHWEQMSRAQQWHLAWTTGPSDLWHTLCQIHPWALVLSVLIQGLVLWVGVIRWRMVLEAQGLDLSLSRATRISLVAQFFNSFLLGSTGGDLFKAYYAARETHHKKTEAVTTVFVDRLIGLWAMLFFAVVMMAPNALVLVAHQLELGMSALLIAAMLVCLTVMLAIAFWGGVSKRLPRARHYLRRLPKGELLEKSLDSCRQYGRQRGLLFKVVLFSIVVNILMVLQIAVLGWGLDLQIPFVSLMMIVPIISCISAVPITPGGLGLRENLYVVMLSVLGVARTAALSVSLLASAEGIFWSLVGGVVYMAAREKEHLSDVTTDSGTDEG
jgi:hypothetical protein